MDTLNDTLNDRQKRILELINEDNFITAEILSEKCNISIETIKRDIAKLIKFNLIVRNGSRKSGYRKINKYSIPD
ncbi:MAG: DeoR family transcriptional regulator [Paludibacter sp.]|nr:DeoR family transcriptional regulator [Paludibacter sp.]